MNITHRERRGGLYDCMDCHGTEVDTHGRCERCGSEAISDVSGYAPGENMADRLKEIQDRLDAATRGPWWVREYPCNPEEFHVSASTPKGHPYKGVTSKSKLCPTKSTRQNGRTLN